MGSVWISALRAAAIPLVLAYVLSAVTSIGEARQTGKLASLCLLSFAGLILLAATYSLPLGYLLSSNFSVDPETLTTLQELVSSLAFEGAAQGAGPPSLGESISRLIPSNLFRAALEDQLLALILAALVFGMAVTRLDTQGREALTQLFQAFARAMMTVVIWILTVMPLGVFSLAFVMARQAGWTAAWTFGYWVLGASALFLGFNLLLYPIASGLGRVPVAWFARAVAPAQLVAIGSRSSLACIPALIEGAEEHLRTPSALTGFVIPLSSASFKLSGTLGSPFQLFILAKLYGVELDPATVGVFMFGILLMSFGTPGIPSGGFVVRLPFFIAAGIPAEGFMLTAALDAIPDIFKTTVNVTGDMTVLSIVRRFAGITESGEESEGSEFDSTSTPPEDRGTSEVGR